MRKRANSVIDKAAAYDDLEMTVLHKISQAIAQKKNVSELIAETLDILSTEMNMVRGTITLREGELLHVEASHGVDAETAKTSFYKMGEGVFGRVAAEGKPIVVREVAKDPDFLALMKISAADFADTAFVCAPISYMEQVIGTLSIFRRLPEDADLERDLELIDTIANILADAVALIYLRHEERNRLLDENRRLKLELATGLMRPKNMLGNCGAMQNVYESISKFSCDAEPVFIRGKSGTGKELAARAICEASKSFDKSFAVVNCAALPDYTLIGELFGFEKDSFANAHFAKKGVLEESENGTVFIDEIAQTSKAAQRMLVEFLRDGLFRRLNSKESSKAPRVKFVFASCADVEALVEQKMFDAELYEIISRHTIHMPALKDRKSDILLLAEYFLEKFNRIYGKSIKRISTPAINMMTIYSWPGNVRELETCMERAVMSTHDSAISGYNLTAAVRARYIDGALPYGEDVDFESMVESFERELITEALKTNRGNAAAAARRLNLSQRVINYKIQKYGITASWYKSAK